MMENNYDNEEFMRIYYHGEELCIDIYGKRYKIVIDKDNRMHFVNEDDTEAFTAYYQGNQTYVDIHDKQYRIVVNEDNGVHFTNEGDTDEN